MQPKIVLLYALSTNGMMLRRFLYAIEQQKQMDRLFPPSPALVPVLFTDEDPDLLPDSIIRFFGRANVHRADATVAYEDGERFCYSKLRNASLEYVTEVASANGWDWIMLCDGDTVIRRDFWIVPQRAWGTPRVYWQKDLNETLQQSLAAVGDGTDKSVFSDGNSWFMLSREMFSQLRFNEQISGYGYEDNEFAQRIYAFWGAIDDLNMLVVHSFHANVERNVQHAKREHNLTIFKASEAMLREGRRSIAPVDVRIYPAVHPHWRGTLALMPEHSRILHVKDKTMGSYEFDGHALHVVWDKWGPEEFVEQDGVLTYAGPSKDVLATGVGSAA